ncbi:ABC transporter substrate-binding protein [Bradyrhizobium sp. Cp5.3]|uniref:substrate-binding periplasmic protein n=1 Tax=Bradyrhizobium sp. Cp5.3 TaxID=443598 RepID=UPI0003FEF47A|nr:transporter substrate-binding domain-containing protein [Bradyrhizobium sp. Cp5.3]
MRMLSRRGFCGGISAALYSLTAGAKTARADDFKVTFYNTFPPLSFENDRREITGILPDAIAEILGRRVGLPVVTHGLPWARAQALVQDGNADAFFTNPTPARLEYAMFTHRAAIETKTELFYALDNPRRAEIEAIRNVEQLAGFRQGDYVGNGFAEVTFKGLQVDVTPTLDSVFRKIAAGRLDFFVGNDLVAKSVLKKTVLGEKIRSFQVDIGRPSQFHIGIRKTFPDVAPLIEKADTATEAALADGTLTRIVAAYTV